MKVLVLSLLLSSVAFAQPDSPVARQACGDARTHFAIAHDDSSHAIAEAPAGRALLYFVQDDGLYGDQQHFTIRMGADGVWAGANKGNGWFSTPIEAGEHHLCASVQSGFAVGSLLALIHLNAEPGKVYFFRTRFLAGIGGSGGRPYLEFQQTDVDEAKYLIASYPLSVAKPNK